jgi:alpha-D-xyloside xylohydrolase
MKILSLLFVFSFILLQAAKTHAGNYERIHEGVRLEVEENILAIRFCTPNIVRFTISTGKNSERNSLVVDRNWAPIKFTVSDSEKFFILKSDSLQVTVNREDGSADIHDRHGNRVIRIGGIDQESLKMNIKNVDSLYEIRQVFTISPDEGLFGLGQFQDGIMNYRGQELYLVQANRTAVNPFLVSTNHYGILWDNYSESTFSEKDNQMHFWSAAGRCVDYYVMWGGDIDAVINGYREATGTAPLFPKWAYGYWQSKERYVSQSDILQIASEFRARQIPIDAIVQDWSYWGDGKMFSGMVWDTLNYPAPEKMVDSLHTKYQIHIMASIWPSLGPASAIFKELNSKGYLFAKTHWSGGKLYDCYNPGARDIYWKHLNAGLFSKGIDAFWMDGSEPEVTSSADPYITGSEIRALGINHLGTFKEFLNPYSLLHTKGVYENQRKMDEKKRVFILTRSVFSGQQRYAAATWSGDIGSNWKVLRNQISAGINFCMSGVPYWTTDIGGFLLDSQGGMYPEGGTDPAFRELYVRWFQFGAFSPIFRSHGTQYPREPWRFGDIGSENYETILKYDRLRYQLMPYIYSTAWQVTHYGSTIMRGLPMDFPQDQSTYGIDNQFMFGPSLMICPVTHAVQYRTNKREDFIPAKNLMNVAGQKGSLDVDYFPGKDTSNSIFHCNIVELGITWKGQIPDSLQKKTYSVIMKGGLFIEDTVGFYTFVISTTGGVQMWIDGKLLIDQPDNFVKTKFSADYRFTHPGVKNIRIFHYQTKPDECNFKLEWSQSTQYEKLNPVLVSYLPLHRGGWFDFWTNERLPGGVFHSRQVPLSIMPIYVQAGTILPLGPAVQSTAEMKNDSLEIRVYPGNDARFTIYEDEGDGYRYEKDAYSEINFQWRDADKKLTIGKRAGKFPGIIKERVFTVNVIDNGNSVMMPQTVNYSGSELTIDFSIK